jgi:histidyl-tRNA synthetase
MANQQVSIPKGTRDFTPEEMAKRNFIFNTIKNVFERFGFQQIETPSMENLSTLLGKYGEEGDKLLFRVLNSGDYLGKVPDGIWDEVANRQEFEASQKLSPHICEKGLRYDLTVPFARFVVQNQGKIQFPFRRFQIQPVWRADRPQKGRYREFYQCDADVIGSSSLINEVELVQVLDEVFASLKIYVTIKINNRKILAGLAEMVGAQEKLTDITVAIDKLDKIGEDNVRTELMGKGINQQQANLVLEVIKTTGNNQERLDQLQNIFEGKSETALKGIAELREVVELATNLGLDNPLETDFTLARGLNYYTGAIIEVKANDVQIGSISGGGRYDDLTGIFGLKGMSGVGISFGADRIYDVLEQLNGFPGGLTTTIGALFVNFGDREARYCLPILKKVRLIGLSAILYPDPAKMKKQMAYANSLNIPFVIMAGEDEMAQNKVTVKNMATGDQVQVLSEELPSFLQSALKR